MKRLHSILIQVAVLAGSLFAQNPRLSQEFDRSKGLVDVIVKFKTPLTADATDSHHQKVARLGGVHKATHHIIQSAAYRLNADRLAELANDPDVEFISPDHPVSSMSVLTSGEGMPASGSSSSTSSSTMTPSASTSSSSSSSSSSSATIAIDYFRETVHSDSANYVGWTGSGVGVAIIDSGITPNEDFKKSLAYSQSFVSGDTSTLDAYGHGTHVAGIIIGSGSNSSSNKKYQFGGAAPDVSLINLRVLDASGNSTDSVVINAIQQAIALKNTYNIRIISLSLGRPVTMSYVNDPLCQAVEAAWKAGIVVVAAAGNEGRNNTAGTNGYGTILAPGNDPYVITVGAMKSMSTSSRNDDLIASYSSKGPTLIDHVVKPDLVAPGNLVISIEVPGSTLATGYPANDVPTSVYSYSGSANKAHKYFVLSGTSMATPVVAGAAAVLLEKFPTLTPDQLKARLMKTTSKSFPTSSSVVDPSTGITYTSYYDIFTVGAGYLDTAAALANNDLGTGSALSPTVAYNSSTKTANLTLSGSSVIWGSSVTWGTSVIWGTNVFVGSSSVIWGSSVSWGTATASASSVIWGSTTASASSVIWGSSTAAAQ